MGDIVVLCGSTRFRDTMDAVERQLIHNGDLPWQMAWAFSNLPAQHLSVADKALLDSVHKRKIERADAILVVDVDGYIGESTAGEIAHAEKQGIEVRYYSKGEHWPRTTVGDCTNNGPQGGGDHA